jgi:predicted lipoprotein with Yx(FWY)xxD motif
VARLVSLFLLLGALALVACGDEEPAAGGAEATAADATPAATTTPARPAARPRRGRTIRVVDSQFGAVLADITGEAVYLFDAETSPRPACYGACAAAWPPVLARGVPVAGSGARARLLGTTRRRDGRVQVTYRGHPLYYYVHDAPGRILCHDVFEYGGTWFVVAPNGRARA